MHCLLDGYIRTGLQDVMFSCNATTNARTLKLLFYPNFQRTKIAENAAMKKAKKALGEAISDAAPWNVDGVGEAVPLPVPFIAPGLEADALAPYEVIVKVSPKVTDDVMVAAPGPGADKAEADIGVKIPDGTMMSFAADNGLIVVLDGVTAEDPLINGVGVALGLLADAPSTIGD